MIDALLTQDLACSPPNQWAKMIRRADILRPLVLKGRLSSGDVGQAKAALGVTRRHFYHLLEQSRLRSAGMPARGPGTGLACHLGKETEAVIAEAFRQAGPNARKADVARQAARLSAERGLPAPSATSIRTRWRRINAHNLFRERLHVDCDFVADLCGLHLCVTDKTGAARPAYLSAVIDCSTGRPVHHQLHAGAPAASLVGDAITAFLQQHTEITPGHSVLGLSAAFTEDDVRNLRVSSWSVLPATTRRKVSAGLPLRISVGEWLGRVRLRAEVASWDSPVDHEPVPLTLAAHVTDYMIRSGGGDASMYQGSYLARTS